MGKTGLEIAYGVCKIIPEAANARTRKSIPPRKSLDGRFFMELLFNNGMVIQDILDKKEMGGFKSSA